MAVLKFCLANFSLSENKLINCKRDFISARVKRRNFSYFLRPPQPQYNLQLKKETFTTVCQSFNNNQRFLSCSSQPFRRYSLPSTLGSSSLYFSINLQSDRPFKPEHSVLSFIPRRNASWLRSILGLSKIKNREEYDDYNDLGDDVHSNYEDILEPTQEFFKNINSAVLVWGAGVDGQNGTGDYVTYESPVVLNCFNDREVLKMSSGVAHTVLLAKSLDHDKENDTEHGKNVGFLYAWGSDNFNQIGRTSHERGGENDQCEPVKLNPLRDMRFIDVAAGYFHSVTLGYIVNSKHRDFRVFAWGGSLLGNGTDLFDGTLINVSSLNGKGIKMVGAGGYHSVACSENSLYTWGWLSMSGLIADEDINTDLFTPYCKLTTPISVCFFEGKKIDYVDCGVWHTTVIVKENDQHKVYIYGNEQYTGYSRPYCPFYHEDGISHRTHAVRSVARVVPDEVIIPDQAFVKKVKCGASFSAVLLENGRLFVFGQNPYVCPGAVGRRDGEYEDDVENLFGNDDEGRTVSELSLPPPPTSPSSDPSARTSLKNQSKILTFSEEEVMSASFSSNEQPRTFTQNEVMDPSFSSTCDPKEGHNNLTADNEAIANDIKNLTNILDDDEKETIVDVDCGMNHILVVTNKGRCYYWGWCVGHVADLGYPELVIDCKSKVMSRVNCGLDFNALY